MRFPLTQHATDNETEKSFYFSLDDPAFYDMAEDNFYCKYEAHYGIPQMSEIHLELYGDKFPQKMVHATRESSSEKY